MNASGRPPRRSRVPSIRPLLPVWATALALSLGLAGCVDMLYSDSANSHRKWEADMKEALRGNRIASQQAAPAEPLTGPAIRQLLSGKTHVSEYRRQSNDAKPYFTVYSYYRPDGRYIVLDTYSRPEPDKYNEEHWTLTGDVLCLTSTETRSEPSCYKLRRQANGTLQYWTHKPGNDLDGLISSSISIVLEGLQTPEYRSTQSPYR